MTASDEKPSRTVLITGCSAGGIGSALAEAFHEKGLHVFATARSLSKMSNLKKLPHVTLLELDVEFQSSISAVVDVVTAKTGGKLDYLVNNSGLALNYPALDTDLHYARKTFDVNFWGMVYVTHAFAPLLIESKGTIVNNSSLAGILHVPWGAFYNSSKAAARMYSETLRLEMAPLGVRVLTIMTGIVRTRIFENSPDGTLPENSYYKVASKEIGELASGKLAEDSMPVMVYAREVVNDVLAGTSGSTWKGKMGYMGWVMSSFFPTWLMDRAFVSGSGLENM